MFFLEATMKNPITALYLSLSLACISAHAQTIPISPNLFGVNYWYYDYAGNVDSFNSKKELVKAAGITFVRLGGNTPNKKLALSDMAHFDTAIDRVNVIGATPLMQLPMNLPAADIAAWVAHFHGKGIRYWAIGNEPDPSSNFYEWYKGTPVGTGTTIKRENGNTYKEFRDKFVRLARAVKAMDPQAIVVGPDYRQWWGTSSSTNPPTEPLLTYYPDFIADVGALTENGAPLLDIFAFHFYGYHNEAENRKRTALVQSYLDSVNTGRTSPLRLAVGEVNGVPGTATAPWSFDAGQFLVMMTKNVVANRGEFVAPWSVYESSGNKGGTDFSTFNSNAAQRSTMVHFSLLANNRRDTYMAGAAENNAYANSVVQFGMTDAGGSTVMLMNTTTSARSYAIRLDDQYPVSNADVKFKFASTNANAAGWVGSLPAKTTLMFTLDANGKRLKKYAYDQAASDAANADANAGPLATDLTVAAAVSGTGSDIALSAVLPHGAARTQIDFLIDGQKVGSAASSPYSLTLDSNSLTNGSHALTVLAYDADGNADASDPVAFTVLNALNVSAQIKTVSSALVLNRTTQTFNGTITLTNNSSAAIAGPLQLRLDGLSSGVTLLNAAGSNEAAPYLSLPDGLESGATVIVKVSFSNPAKAVVQYQPAVYSGTF